MEISQFERQIIDALLDGPDQMLSDLREQCDNASVSGRDFTGAGFFAGAARSVFQQNSLYRPDYPRP